MRSVAVLGVLAGCNQIYGLDPTKVIDAGPPPRHVSLTYMIATEDSNDVHLIDSDTPVRGVMALSASTLDGAQTLDLMPAYAGSGVVEVPEVLAGRDWRLAYTIAGDVPREVQTPPAGDLHLVVPIFGPLDKSPVPMGSGYSVTPQNFAGNGGDHAIHRVFTTGVWTQGFVVPSPTNATLNYPFGVATSLFGPIGAPNDPGDQVLVVDYKIDAAGCRAAIGSAQMELALTPNQLAVPSPQPQWDSSTLKATLFMDPVAALGRLTGVNAFADNPGPAHIELGFIASDRMPAFEAAPQLPLVLPGPVIVPVDVCPWQPAPPVVPTIPDFHDSALGSNFTAVLHAEATIVRDVDGLTLTSGMAVVAERSGIEPMVSYAPAFAAPTIMKASLAGVDLLGAADHVPVPDRATPLSLTLELTGGDDYTEVTLHQVAGGALQPVRRYTVFGPSVDIDPTTFSAGGEYVFEIRTFTGRPGAAFGDFRIATLPQSMVTMFTRTFTTP